MSIESSARITCHKGHLLLQELRKFAVKRVRQQKDDTLKKLGAYLGNKKCFTGFQVGFGGETTGNILFLLRNGYRIVLELPGL